MKMLTHLRIQHVLGVVVVSLTVAVHFWVRVVPGLSAPWTTFEPIRAMPYAVVVLAVELLRRLRTDRSKSYSNFVMNSPGLKIDTSGIVYGTGHPTAKEK
jgi:hypothetical protein